MLFFFFKEFYVDIKEHLWKDKKNTAYNPTNLANKTFHEENVLTLLNIAGLL